MAANSQMQQEQQYQELQRLRSAGEPASQQSAASRRNDRCARQRKTHFRTRPIPSTKANRRKPRSLIASKEQLPGTILGIALASFRDKEGTDRFLLLPGDDVKVTFPNAGMPPKIVSESFTIVDFYESKMSEYDSQFRIRADS